MANILAGLGPWRRVLLDTPRMYALCAAADSYFGDADATTLVGAAGDAFLVHPLLLHTASASTRRARLRAPLPLRRARRAPGAAAAPRLGMARTPRAPALTRARRGGRRQRL